MVNYENGKIYLLKSKNSDKVYVGSTCEKYLSSRFAKHNYDFNKKKISTQEIYECGDVYIELYECYPCSCKEELLKREKEVINKISCVNKHSPITSIEERKEKRKKNYKLKEEYYKKVRKEYLDKNKEKIKKVRKEYLDKNKEKIKEVRKEYEEKNKDKIQQRLKKIIKCDCGMEIQHRSYKRHLTRSLHKKNLLIIKNKNVVIK